MKNNNSKKTMSILLGVIILNLLLAGAYAYSFYTVKVKNEAASLVSEELEEYLSKEGTINLLKASVKRTEEDREKIDSYFVARDDIPDFARKIEALSDLSGTNLIITGLSTQDNILSFDITSTGSFRDTMQLISLIENLPFKVEI